MKGYCHLNPPKPIFIQMAEFSQVVSYRPEVDGDDYCCAHKIPVTICGFGFCNQCSLFHEHSNSKAEV